MVQMISFKSLLCSCYLIAIFESAVSSFVPSFAINFPAGACINLHHGHSINAGSKTVHHRKFLSLRITKPKIRTVVNGASAPYGNITAPSLSNRNGNEPVEIPIIGPLLNIDKPIIIGNSLWLDPPTPLQWNAVEASVAAQHGRAIMNRKATITSDVDEVVAEKINLATIANSPLVAIIGREGKDYATIAAIEGIVTKKDGSIDTNDAESFRESLASLSCPYYSDASKVRFMAIGRAKVSHFTTKFLMDDSFVDNNGYIQYKDNENKDESSNRSEPLLVARMELLFDSNEKGETTSSPVHALNRLSRVAQRVRFLQQDRQRIVRGLQVAQSRLEMAMERWEDWDGIGTINAAPTTESDCSYNDDQNSMLNNFLEEYNDENSTPIHSLPLSAGAARCLELDNYGLGTTSSAFASINSMTDLLMGNLENYYSPSRVQSEEFEYEVFSWCALQSLQPYLRSGEIHEALYECKSTSTRLEILYHAMVKHKMELDELARAKSLELRNCGEECDLL